MEAEKWGLYKPTQKEIEEEKEYNLNKEIDNLIYDSLKEFLKKTTNEYIIMYCTSADDKIHHDILHYKIKALLKKYLDEETKLNLDDLLK